MKVHGGTPFAPERVGEVIRAARERLGVERWELAQRLAPPGLSPFRIADVEDGTIDPTVGQLLAIAKALGVHPATLLPVVEAARPFPIGTPIEDEAYARASGWDPSPERLAAARKVGA